MPALRAARTSCTRLAITNPAPAEASAINTEIKITAAGEAPASTPNTRIPTSHKTVTCNVPRAAMPKNFPNTTASRRTPFASSRSSVCACRSRAIASALNAAPKNTNIVK